jgi:hypothetical protein
MLRLAALSAGLLAAAAPAAAAIVINYEAPGVQNSTATFDVVGVETFESRALGLNTLGFTTDFGTGGTIVATYTGGRIDNANVYGSAGGVGKHIVTFKNGMQPIDVTFTTTLPQGLNYFGYWLSALDANNRIDFFKGATLLGTITPATVSSALGACPGGLWCGNPTTPFLGQVAHEQFAFLNVYFTNGMTYDRIRFYQVGGGGYESDNHTVGYFLKQGGVVPEPATWAMLIAGFGLVGFAMRRRGQRRIASVSA